MKKYRNFFILIIFAMGSQSLMYFSLKFLIHNYNIISSFIDVPLVKHFVYYYDSWYPFIVLNAFLIYIYDKKLFKCSVINPTLSHQSIFGREIEYDFA